MQAASQSVSSVPLSTHSLRDQAVSLTGMCATERRPVHRTGLRASDQRRWLAPRLVLYGCVAEWLALRCARGSPPDGCWDSGGHGAENPIKRQFQALALRR